MAVWRSDNSSHITLSSWDPLTVVRRRIAYRPKDGKWYQDFMILMGRTVG